MNIFDHTALRDASAPSGVWTLFCRNPIEAGSDYHAIYERSLGSKITVQLNIDNLLGKQQPIAQPFGGAPTFVSVGAPRTFLGSVRVEW